MSLTASRAGENSQTNDPEHTIVSSIPTDLIFRRDHERRAVLSEPSLNRRRSWDRATRFKTQNRHNNSINSNINLDLGFSEIKDETRIPNPLNHDTFVFPHKNPLFPHNRFSNHFFSMKMAELGKKHLRKLHYRFRRYSTLPETVLLESQHLQSYDDLLQILAKEINKTAAYYDHFSEFCHLHWKKVGRKSIVGKSGFLWGKRINSSLARSKRLTNCSYNDPNNTIQLRDFLENQITREDRITLALALRGVTVLSSRLCSSVIQLWQCYEQRQVITVQSVHNMSLFNNQGHCVE